jgi:VanZ family protein
MTIKLIAKFCSAAALVLLVIVALGPAKWTPRTALGWEIDHFLGYFAITLMFCLAWPRPFMVGAALMAVAALLEVLQALTPDRSSYFLAAFYGAGGVLAAALLAELVIRVRRRRSG